MAFNWICVTFSLLFCLCCCGKAAPYGDDWNKFSEMERTLKELAMTVLSMNGAGLGTGGSAVSESNYGDMDMNVLGNEVAATLLQVHI